MDYGDKVVYIGHTAKCASCVQATKPKPVIGDGLDDRDEFGEPDVWERHLNKICTINGPLSVLARTIWVEMDDKITRSVYVEHLEEVQHADQAGDL